jgi:hypothetical protein
MARPAKPFVFELWASEIAQIHGASADSHEYAFYVTIADQLQGGGCAVTLNDAQFGQLVRYISERSSDFQLRLFRAFSRSVYGLLAG